MMTKYKEFRYNWVNNPKNNIVSFFPLAIDIELTNRCSLSCLMCPFHGPDAINKRQPQDMDFELYKKIIDEGSEKGLCSIKLNFGGEPLLYEKLPEAIKYAKDKGILDVQINTNGMTCHNDLHKYKDIIDTGLDLLILSDYGFDKQYILMNFIMVYKNLINSKKPKIRIKTEKDYLWKELANEIIEPKYYDYCNLTEKFTPNHYKCLQPWQRMLVLTDGTIYQCSCGFIDDGKIIGNIKYMTIEDAWRSKKMNFIRSCHEHGDSHLLRTCRKCPARNEVFEKR